ncbi:outer membrane beta-barrel protein [Methylocystis heyeri]|uniref:Outer membrane beta-barrel protein n=1 Tax=Methylocystis heyeri TaxID=391905 RepID=A0A6B8KD39_9HYPH|nr:outer membrane beta-barrel protein [Methylocystis heyeri]QGM44931.1 outer membrane beta-barrel protein [Methylocystis heyeri]
MNFRRTIARLAVLALGALASVDAIADEEAPTVAAMGPALGPDPNQSMSIDGWLVYPTFMTGVIFNDNIYQTQINRRAGVGLSLQPNILAEQDNGLHKTSVHINAYAEIYPGQGGSELLVSPGLAPAVYVSPTNVTGRAAVSHVWTPMADLSVKIIGEYERQSGLFATNLWGAQPEPAVASGVAVSSVPQYSNQFTGQISVEKQLADRWFVRGSAGAQYISYDSRPVASTWALGLSGAVSNNFAAQNGNSYNAALRAGFWITPQLYAFIQPEADIRIYQESYTNTNGYDILCGVGFPRTGLYSGEIYAGYQTQTSAWGNYGGRVSSPALGVRFAWYPTEYFVLTASLSETLSTAPSFSTAFINGVPFASVMAPGEANNSRTLQAQLQGDYSFSPYWKAHVRGGFADTKWTNPTNVQTIWNAGGGIEYTFWRNVALTLEYRLAKTFNSQSVWSSYNPQIPSGYTQNIVSAGVRYAY